MSTLNKLETHESWNYLNTVMQAPLFYGYHQPQSLSPSMYMELIESVKKTKNVRIFTHSPNGFHHPSIPNLYFTKLGHKLFRLAQDYTHNPYFSNRLNSVFIHPEIHLFGQLMFKHNLNNFSYSQHYQYLEQACEVCIADFKVQIQLSIFKADLKSWNTKFTCANSAYDHFISFIARETNIFEVHSILIQRQLRHGREPEFGDPEFADPAFGDLSALEIVEEKAKQIISTVWKNRQNNDVLGILSKKETNVCNTSTIRLIFFVKRMNSDLVEFNQTQLFKILKPFLIEYDLDSVSIGTKISTMNTGCAPLFQGQHSNYYDMNQIHTGNRLNILKSQIVTSDIWLRIKSFSTTVTVERGANEYHRGK